ncbi:MAG: hypothetical protein EOM21_04975 [Gammaproteobacteria bacterium]|nr:hypothetical protein [Gammaproteobacteria bacterium]
MQLDIERMGVDTETCADACERPVPSVWVKRLGHQTDESAVQCPFEKWPLACGSGWAKVDADTDLDADSD